MADDGVAGDRRAALGVAEHQAFGAADRQRAFWRRQLFAFGRQQAARDHVGHAVAQADVFEQIFYQLQAVLGENRLDAFLGDFLQAAVEASEYLVQQALAQADGFGAALLLERVADIRACLA
ncbi:hypothetical protein D9M71_730120 [compost metagenome]